MTIGDVATAFQELDPSLSRKQAVELGALVAVSSAAGYGKHGVDCSVGIDTRALLQRLADRSATQDPLAGNREWEAEAIATLATLLAQQGAERGVDGSAAAAQGAGADALEQAFRRLDADGNGTLSRDEFVSGLEVRTCACRHYRECREGSDTGRCGCVCCVLCVPPGAAAAWPGPLAAGRAATHGGRQRRRCCGLR